MQRYFSVLVLLSILAIGSFFAWDSYNRKYVEIAATHADAAAREATEQTRVNESQKIMADWQKRSAVAAKFLGAWSIHVQEGNSGPGAISSSFANFARKYNLLGNRQPTPLKDGYPLAGGSVTVQQVGFTVIGPYTSVMKWLGEAEEAYLFGRIESIDLKSTSGTDVELNCQFTFMQEKETNPGAVK